jgi:hypothetical protein
LRRNPIAIPARRLSRRRPFDSRHSRRGAFAAWAAVRLLAALVFRSRNSHDLDIGLCANFEDRRDTSNLLTLVSFRLRSSL